MSLDISFALTYRAFPMGSEDNTFDVEITDPGFFAHMGSFTFGATEGGWLGTYRGQNTSAYSGSSGGGFSANLSADFELTPFVRGRVYDRPSYSSAYVDQRGYSDPLSGQRYEVFQNIVGLDLDWQMAEDKTFGYSASRTDTIPQNNAYDISRSVIYQQMLKYRQQVNPLTAAGLRADYYWRDYLGARGSQFQQDYEAFMTSEVTEDSSISAALGYSMLELNSAGRYEANGISDVVIGEVGLQTRLSEFLSHGISYQRSQRAGFMAGAEVVDRIGYHVRWVDPESWAIAYRSDYESVTPKLVAARAYTDWLNQISASRPLTHDFVLVLASAYSMRMNKQPMSGEIGEGQLFLSNNYDTWTSTVGLIQTLTARLKLYYYGEHIARISSNPLLKGTRDTVGMTLGYYYDF